MFIFGGKEHFEDQIITIEVKPGTIEGTQFRFVKHGDENIGTIPADVVFVARIKPHSDFNVKGSSLIYTALVTKSEAANGIELEIPTLDQNGPIIYTFKHVGNGKIPDKIFPDRGLPLIEEPSKRGNFIVKIELVKDELKGNNDVNILINLFFLNLFNRANS